MATIRKNLNGVFTTEELNRLSFPIAWSGTVPADETADEERQLRSLVRDALEAIEEASRFSELEGELAAKIENGELVEIVEA